MKKIVVFHPLNDFTGSSIALASYIKENNNNEFIIITRTHEVGALDSLENGCLVNIHSRKDNKATISNIITYFIAVFLTACKYRNLCDTFFINTISPWYASIYSFILRKKVVYYVHETFVVRSLINKLKKYVFEHTKSHCIFVSHYAKEFYNNKLHTTEIRYNKLRPGYLDNLPTVNYNNNEVHQKVLMISSLSLSKGIATFFKVAMEMSNYKFEMLISSSLKEIYTFIKDNDLVIPDNVTINSKSRDPRVYILGCDIVLNLSIPTLWVETFGLTIIESLVLGKPVIAPNIGGPCEIIDNGVDGYLIDVTNISEVVSAIKKVSTPLVYEAMSNKARIKGKKFI